MRVAAIWRYPVKSMAGERLSRAEISSAGLVGDRVVQVYDRRGRIVTARTYPRLLRLRATLGSDGEPLVDGLLWSSPEIAKRVEAAVAPGARLERFDGLERFDILPLLVCTDGAVGRFGRDVRRLRPNILIGGVDDNAERYWEGATLRLPHAEVGVADLRGRCVMTTSRSGHERAGSRSAPRHRPPVWRATVSQRARCPSRHRGRRRLRFSCSRTIRRI